MQDQSGFSPYLFNIKNGQRASTADAYLRPALKRDNLDVVLNTQVRKILFDDNKRAIGIEATQNHGETIFEVRNSARCLKITKKVAFNIASEASCVYIMNGQKLIENAKMDNFGDFLKTWGLRSNSVARQVQKLAKIDHIRHF